MKVNLPNYNSMISFISRETFKHRWERWSTPSYHGYGTCVDFYRHEDGHNIYVKLAYYFWQPVRGGPHDSHWLLHRVVGPAEISIVEEKKFRIYGREYRMSTWMDWLACELYGEFYGLMEMQEIRKELEEERPHLTTSYDSEYLKT